MVSDASVDGSRLSLKSGDTVTWFAVPEGGMADELASSANGVTGVTALLRHRTRRRRHPSPTRREGSDDTLLAALPHQYDALDAPDADACDLGTYESVYGTMHLCAGAS